MIGTARTLHTDKKRGNKSNTIGTSLRIQKKQIQRIHVDPRPQSKERAENSEDPEIVSKPRHLYQHYQG